MRLTIDCQAIQSKNSMNRGIGNYSLDIVRSILVSKLDIKITLLVNGRLSTECIEKLLKDIHISANVEVRTWFPLENTSWLSKNQLRRELSEWIYEETLESTSPDHYLLLSPFEGLNEEICWVAPKNVYSSVVFYDAIPARYPERYLASNDTKKWYFSTALKLKQFNKIFAISNSSANDAIEIFGINRNQIETISFGLHDHYFDDTISTNSEGFVLAVLGEDERKNKINLLKAWEIVIHSHPNLMLRIVYKQSVIERRINEKYIQKGMLSQQIEFLDYVPEDELKLLYKNCLFSIFPSFYEGLGLPVLESLATGKACLVSNRSSLPELVSNENLLFNPDSPEDISLCILRLIADKVLYASAIEEAKKIISPFRPENKIKQISDMFLTNEKDTSSEKAIHPEGLYLYTILPPSRSGIADYTEHLLHELHLKITLNLVSSGYKSDVFICNECGYSIPVQDPENHKIVRNNDYVEIHNIGNSEFHVWQYELIKNYPGLLIMHDGFLSGLVWSLFQGTVGIRKFLSYAMLETSNLNFIDDSYIREPHKLILKEKLNSQFIESASGVVIHNSAAKKMIEEDYFFADQGFLKVIPQVAKNILPSYSVDETKCVIGVFGIIAESKMYKEILDAWILSKSGESGKYILRFIGEDFSNDFILIKDGIAKDYRIECTGYASPQEYQKQINEVRFAIQLRRSFRGETSGALTELLSRGIPVITNVDAWTEDFPEISNLVIPKTFTLIELAERIDWVEANIEGIANNLVKVRERIEKYANPSHCAEELLQFALERNVIKKYTSVAQLKNIFNAFPESKIGEEILNDCAIACLKSFPNTANKYRILVILSSSLDLQNNSLYLALQKLSNEIENFTHLPIFFCRRNTSENELECLLEVIKDPNRTSLINRRNFLIRSRPSDVLVWKERISGPFEKLDLALNLIRKEMGEFLDN